MFVRFIKCNNLHHVWQLYIADICEQYRSVSDLLTTLFTKAGVTQQDFEEVSDISDGV